MTPTQRTLALLRKEGWLCHIAEHWNAYAHIRQDAFGVIDIIALRPGTILGIQCTSAANHAARREKMRTSEGAAAWLAAGGKLELWSWGRRGPRGKRKTWQVNREPFGGGTI